MLVAVTELAGVAAAGVKVTDAGEVNPVPVKVTAVPIGPEVGENPVSVGAVLAAAGDSVVAGVAAVEGVALGAGVAAVEGVALCAVEAELVGGASTVGAPVTPAGPTRRTTTATARRRTRAPNGQTE
jgi:hypothetical protein